MADVGVKTMKVGDIADPEDAFAASKVEDQVFTFCWDVENFSKIQNHVDSPVFKDAGGSYNDRFWSLQLYPRDMKDGVEYFATYLYLSSGTKDSSVTAFYQISLIDANRKILASTGPYSTPKEFIRSGLSWGPIKWIKRSDLIEGGFLTNDTLRIHCRITTNSKLKHKEVVQNKIDPESEDHMNLVKEQMKSFLTNGEFSDTTLKTESNSFHCSRILLAAHSPVFRAMFSSGMIETQKNVVEIQDFSNEVVKGMLEFMYVGQVESLSENAMDLLKISDKYQINGLKSMCAEVLVKELTIENAAETLILADLHGPISLKQKVISFITRNRKTVQRTDGYVLMKEHHKSIFVDLYAAID